MRHWVKELENAETYQGEEEELTRRRFELMNAEKIIESLSYSYNLLTQGSDVLSALRKAQNAVDKANSHVDGKYCDIIDTLERAYIESDRKSVV